MTALLLLVMAYVFGSVPFSYLVARRWGVTDVRKVGSGNVGATNVMRSAGRTAGLLAFALDAFKGTAAVTLALHLGAGPGVAAGAAAAAVVGHMYPLWLGFRGGKGVATGAGAFLPLAPIAAAAAVVAFGLTLAATRYVSLGSIAGTLTLALVAFLRGAPPPVAWSALGIGSLIVWKHRGNLERMLKGTESRMGSARP